MKRARLGSKSIFAAALMLIASASHAEILTVVGTGDGVNVLKSIGEAFSQQHPGTSVDVPKSIGSGGGIKSVGGDKNIVGRVARNIKDKEKHFELSYLPFAKVPVVFFVNKSVGIDNLSSQQILDIYSGKVGNWKQVGGPDMKVRVVRREDGDSSLSRLKKSFPGFADITLTEKSKTTYSTPETFEIVTSKKGTIGFGPNDVASKQDVTVLSVDGVAPSAAEYPSVTTLGLVFKEENKSGTLKNFLEFAVSPAAHSAITGAGGLPM